MACDLRTSGRLLCVVTSLTNAIVLLPKFARSPRFSAALHASCRLRTKLAAE